MPAKFEFAKNSLIKLGSELRLSNLPLDKYSPELRSKLVFVTYKSPPSEKNT